MGRRACLCKSAIVHSTGVNVATVALMRTEGASHGKALHAACLQVEGEGRGGKQLEGMQH